MVYMTLPPLLASEERKAQVAGFFSRPASGWIRLSQRTEDTGSDASDGFFHAVLEGRPLTGVFEIDGGSGALVSVAFKQGLNLSASQGAGQGDLPPGFGDWVIVSQESEVTVAVGLLAGGPDGATRPLRSRRARRWRQP